MIRLVCRMWEAFDRWLERRGEIVSASPVAGLWRVPIGHRYEDRFRQQARVADWVQIRPIPMMDAILILDEVDARFLAVPIALEAGWYSALRWLHQRRVLVAGCEAPFFRDLTLNLAGVQSMLR